MPASAHQGAFPQRRRGGRDRAGAGLGTGLRDRLMTTPREPAAISISAPSSSGDANTGEHFVEAIRSGRAHRHREITANLRSWNSPRGRYACRWLARARPQAARRGTAGTHQPGEHAADGTVKPGGGTLTTFEHDVGGIRVDSSG